MSFAAFKSARSSDAGSHGRFSGHRLSRLRRPKSTASDRWCVRVTRSTTNSECAASIEDFEMDYDIEDVMTEFVPEKERVQRLQQIQPAFQSEGEEPFNSIVRLVRSIFHVPIVLVSLVYDDFQWFKAGVGLDVNQTPRCQSFCAHTFAPLQPEVLYIENALTDSRFCANHLVLGPPNIRFYCGVPLVTQDHIRLGALCMIEDQPRSLGAKGMQMLINIAELTIRELLKSEVGKKAYMQRLLSEGRPQIRKLPSLARAQAIRELWFAHVMDEGILIVDAGTPNWHVLWTTPTWIQITRFSPKEQQSIWRLISPVNGQTPQQIHKRVLKTLTSGKAKATVTAQVLSNLYDTPSDTPGLCLTCKVCCIDNFKSLLAPLIHMPELDPAPSEASPINITEGPLLVIRASVVCPEKAKQDALAEKESEYADPKLQPIVSQIRRLDDEETGMIKKEVLFELLERVKPGNGKKHGPLMLEASGVERSGMVPYVEFFEWLLETGNAPRPPSGAPRPPSGYS